MPRRCGLGCTPTRGVLHVFPNPNKFPEQFKAWVRVVSGKDECDFDYKTMRICDRHFTDKDRNRNNRLNALAVPSLFLHDNLADMQTQSEPNVSTRTIFEPSVGQPQSTDNLQSTSDNLADVQAQSEPNVSTRTMSDPSVGQPQSTDNLQSTSDNLADVQAQSEPNVSTRTMSDPSVGQPQSTDNLQSTSDNLADVQTQSEPNVSTRTMSDPSVGQPQSTDNLQSTSDNLADVQTQSEPNVSTRTMSDPSVGQPQSTDNLQSTSDNLADVQTQSEPNVSTRTMSDPSVGQPQSTANLQSTSGEPPEVCGNPLLDHNYCTPSKEHQKAKSWKSNMPLAATAWKYRIYQKNIKNLRRQIYRLRKRGKDMKSRLENAEKLFNKSDFQKLVKDMKPAAKVFTNMQYYQTQKKPTGRRFKIEEKILSLALFKRSPKCYGLMSKYFILPSTKSLKRLLAQVKLSPGINKKVFEKLKKTVSNFDTADKLCTIIFDEMSIMPQIQYDSSKDELKGFANHGNGTIQIANHALVFMVKGLKKHYKQPVAYYFTNSLNRFELKTIIKEVIKNVQETGLIVLATVCDQSTVNVGAIEELFNETKANYLRKGKEIAQHFIELNKKRIVPLYDVPHLLKGLRNNLLNKNMSYIDYEDGGKTKIVKWEYLQQLYAADKSFGELRCLQKLTEEHIVPEKIKKMRVKTAAQIFSHSVAVATEHLTARGKLPKECRDLIPITLLLDNLFDSLNCNSFQIPSGKVYKGPVRRNSPHHQLWLKAIKYLKSVKFETCKKVGNKIQKCETVVPSVKNFIKTIEGIQELWKILSQKYSFDSMFTRNFNQDPVENFFGNIRNCGARNTVPNSVAFEGAFKTLLLNNLSAPHSANANCEEDKNDFLQSLDFFIKTAPESDVSEGQDAQILPESNVFEEKEINIRTEFLNSDIVSDLGQRDYVCGWVLRKCLINIIKSCKTCRKSVLSTENTDENSYIRAKEYFQNKKLLCYPSKQLHECFLDVQNICVTHLEKDVLKTGLKKSIKIHAELFVEYPFKCETHKEKLKQYFTDVTINIIVFSWCRSVNRILAGKLTYDGEDEIKLYAQNYYNKHRHNKNNK